MPAVLVVGSVHVDLVASAVRLPRRGETLPGTGFAIHPGGKGGNQAMQVALSGVGSTMIGRVGRDPFGDRLRAALRTKGVDTTFLSEDPEAPTGSSTVMTGEDGDYASVIVPGAAGCLDRGDLDAAGAAFDAADVLLLQLEIPVETVAAAIEMATAADLTVILNAAPAPVTPDDLPPALLRGVDVLIVNRVEAEMLSGRTIDGIAGAADAGRSLLQWWGATAVAITLGADGVLLVREDAVRHYRAWSVPVIDTIGAGDAFSGTVAASIARGMTFEESVLLGNAAGALAVTRGGAYDALPTAEAVRVLIASAGDRETHGGPADGT